MIFSILLPETYQAERNMSAPLKIFIIYAREDRGYKDDLLKSLKLLQTQGFIEPWHDSDIKPGDEWDKEIKAHLQAADVILPIISFNLIDSDYINRVEIKETFHRYDKGESILIIPILARSCSWRDTRLKDFHVLPSNGRPIKEWPDKDKAWTSVYEGVKAIILDKKKSKRAEKYSNQSEDANIYINRGLSMFNLDQYSEAIVDFDLAIRIFPDHADAYFYRGKAKYLLKHYNEALEDFDQVIRIYPDNADAYFYRGKTKYLLKHYNEAIKDYDQAIRMNPDFTDAYLERGNVKDDLGEYAEAVKDYDHAIGLNPKCAMAYNNRGWAKKNLGFLKEAKKDYEKALSIEPEHRHAKENLIDLKSKMKQKP